jgi:hypothetical protein
MKTFSQQQLKASNEAIDNFVKGAALWGILLAQMQSGKTDTYLRIGCELLDKNLVDFIVIFSGNSETDLCDQVYENIKEEQRNVKNPVPKPSSFWPKYLASKEESLSSVPQQFRSFALEGMKATNKAKISIVWGTELNNYSGPTERTLFIWDEAHFAQNITQRPDKFLKRIGISANGDSSLLKEKQNLVLSVSATPFSELSDIHHLNQMKFIIKMEPGETYVSVKQIRDSKRLIGYSNLESGLRTAFSLYNSAEGPQWAVIRISKKSEDLVKDLCMVNGWRFVVYDSISKEKDEGKKAWDSMSKAPKCNTAILIRGMCRMGKNMQKKHLSFVFETAKKSSTDTVLQGLLGRCCGYSEGSSKVYVFVSQKIIDSKEIDRYIELWDNDGIQIMPTKANNLIANKETKYKHPIIPFAIENVFNFADSNKTVLNKVRNLLSNTQFVPPKTEETQFQEIKKRICSKTDYQKNVTVVHNVCNNITTLKQPKWKHFCEEILRYNSTDDVIPKHLWHTGIKDSKGEEGRIINIFRYDNDMPEYGIKSGTVYIYGVTEVKNSVFSKETNIPRTTQREIFAHSLENGIQHESNGGFTILLSPDTAIYEDVMLDELMFLMNLSESNKGNKPNFPSSIDSCYDCNNNEFKGILVNATVLNSLENGKILDAVSKKLNKSLKIEKALTISKELEDNGFTRLTSISW